MSSIKNEILALRKQGGYLRQDFLSIVEVSGQDAGRFLQARLSNDVLALQPGQGQRTSLLDGKAKIIATGWLYRVADAYWFLTDREHGQKVLGLFEQFHFREKISYKLLTEALWGAHGAKLELLLLAGGAKGLSKDANSVSDATIYERPVKVIRTPFTGEPGITVVHEGSAEKFEQEAKALNMVPLSADALHVACIEAGDPGFNLDGVLMPETGLEQTAVSYTKGCFPGQEVLARVKTYGATKRGLTGLVFDGDGLDLGTGAISLGTDEIGTIHQCIHSPTLGRTIALAFLQRDHNIPGNHLDIKIDGKAYGVTIAELPFYSAAEKKDKAKSLYDAALKEFAHGSETKAIELLRETIELDPLFADAYESIGVILQRNDQLDEAIVMIKQLAALDPESIMAHANLSVFYMQQGKKEAAEEEKAVAMTIRMNQMARDMAAERREQEERKRMKEAAQQRMEMFRQVLAIDPDDFLANAGLGTVYCDLEEYEQAIAHLQKALATKPNHTVAYVALGEALEATGRQSEAIDVYKRGVAVAAQRGDGEPLKKMQIRLDKLTASSNK